MPTIMNKIYEYLLPLAINFMAALVIFFIGKLIARFLSRATERVLLRSKLNQTLAVFTKHIVYFGIMVFVAVAALNKIGVETTSFVAIIGAAGLAVAFALQGSLANFAAGVLIVIFNTFEVGNIIEGAGAIGKVQEIHIFNTVLITADNKKVIIPNAKITSDKIIIHYTS